MPDELCWLQETAGAYLLSRKHGVSAGPQHAPSTGAQRKGLYEELGEGPPWDSLSNRTGLHPKLGGVLLSHLSDTLAPITNPQGPGLTDRGRHPAAVSFHLSPLCTASAVFLQMGWPASTEGGNGEKTGSRLAAGSGDFTKRLLRTSATE